MFPWLLYLRKAGGGRLSDIEFLSIKEFDGKLVKNEGARTTAGTLATLTASSGKDMYIARAVLVPKSTSTDITVPTAKIELQANGVVIETVDFKFGSSNGTRNLEPYVFQIIGIKVAATQVIRLEVTAITKCNLEGAIECFEETTGESPAI